MTDFEAALRTRLSRNAELAAEREAAERKMDRAQADAEEAARQREEDLAASRRERHAALAAHLDEVAGRLKAAAPDDFVVRRWWSPTGEEFHTKVSTRGTRPARTLFVELDRDDDEVLARWSGDLGSSVEMWRLLEVDNGLLAELVLQVADEALWKGQTKPPTFPGHDSEDKAGPGSAPASSAGG